MEYDNNNNNSNHNNNSNNNNNNNNNNNSCYSWHDFQMKVRTYHMKTKLNYNQTSREMTSSQLDDPLLFLRKLLLEMYTDLYISVTYVIHIRNI